MDSENSLNTSLKYKILTKFSGALILLTLVFILTFFLLNVISLNLKYDHQEAKVNAAINVSSSLVRNIFDRIFSDLNFLYASSLFNDYVQNPTNHNQERLENEFISFENSSHLYDQIRFIDARGMERIRVDYHEDGSTIVPREKLQSKKDRDYFIDTAAIKDDKFYVSRLDLNRENGKIVKPLKPMLRFAKPIKDKNNNFKGILILNYFGEHFLNSVRKHFANTPGDTSLVNVNGFWLLNADPENQWGGILEHGKNFKSKYPDVWKKIKTENRGMIHTKTGVFTFTKVQPLLNFKFAVSNHKHFLDKWKIVIKNQPLRYSLESLTKLNVYVPVLMLGYLIGAFLIFIWARASVGKMKAERNLKHLNVALEAIVMDRTLDLTRRAEELEATKNAVIFGMASLAEIRDPDTGSHLKRTQVYTRMLAMELRKHPDFSNVLTDELINMYAKSSPLHDIGKVGVPDAILLKKGVLTPEEFEQMKWHTTYGAQIIERSITNLKLELHSDEGIEFLSVAKDIIGGHHEKWDGSGYPLGLSGDDIPISARIMAVADVYDALSNKRPYKVAFPREKVEAIILEGKGGHYDPRIIDAFVNIKDDFWFIKNELSEEIDDV
ncbi:MAG: HD domain-containing protein [Psychromonas sp.]|nr:HD domain-containing protein [Psychromonas sp.]